MQVKKVLAIAGLLLPLPAMAVDSFVAGYYVPKADLEVTVDGLGSGEDDGDGFGLNTRIMVAPSLGFTGEYQSLSYDDSDGDIDQLRVGGGWFAENGFALTADFVQFDFDGDEVDGFGLHARFTGKVAQQVELFGELGYNNVEDDAGDEADGIEYLFGGAFYFNEQFSAFADYRSTSLEFDGGEFEFTDLRVGGRLHFGGGT